MLLANIFHGDTTEQICAVIIKQNIAQPISRALADQIYV